MGSLKKYYFGKTKLRLNTFIGGISSVCNSASVLANALSIPVSSIKMFTITGSDVSCSITQNYSVPSGFFTDIITYFDDSIDGKCLAHAGFVNFNDCKNVTYVKCKNATVGSYFLSAAYNLRLIWFPNMTSVPIYGFTGFGTPSPFVNLYYLPKLDSCGGTVGDNQVFFKQSYTDGIYITKIVVSPVLKTNNGGLPDGDLAYANANGAAIFYKSNEIAPVNPTINLLEIGARFIKFVGENTSANNIVMYEVYKNDILIAEKKIGQEIKFLEPNTTYSNWSFVAIDESFNRSAKVSIAFTTKGTANINTNGLLSWYKFDDNNVSNIIDSYGYENFTNGTSVLLPSQSGKVNTSFLNTGNAYLTAPSCTALSQNLSINFWLNRRTGGSGGNRTIFDQGSDTDNTGFGIWINSTGNVGARVNAANAIYKTEMLTPLDSWCMITVTYDGQTIKFYLNGVFKVQETNVKTVGSSSYRRLFRRASYAEWIYANIDELSVWKEVLSQERITELYNSGSGLTLIIN